jgi:hypothetical protein
MDTEKPDLSTEQVRELLHLARGGALMEDIDLLAAALEELLRVRDAEPKPAILFCPKCSELHVDKLEEDGTDWTKRRHRKHLCHNKNCKHVWQPFDFPTYGVQLPATLLEAMASLTQNVEELGQQRDEAQAQLKRVTMELEHFKKEHAYLAERNKEVLEHAELGETVVGYVRRLERELSAVAKELGLPSDPGSVGAKILLSAIDGLKTHYRLKDEELEAQKELQATTGAQLAELRSQVEHHVQHISASAQKLGARCPIRSSPDFQYGRETGALELAGRLGINVKLDGGGGG